MMATCMATSRRSRANMIDRETFKKPPSGQHRIEEHKSNYRIRARASDVFIIPLKQRDLALGRGRGWIGQANWWFPEQSSNVAVKAFLRKVHALLDAGPEAAPATATGP